MDKVGKVHKVDKVDKVGKMGKVDKVDKIHSRSMTPKGMFICTTEDGGRTP